MVRLSYCASKRAMKPGVSGFFENIYSVFQGRKAGYFCDLFEGTRDILTIGGNFFKTILGNRGIY